MEERVIQRQEERRNCAESNEGLETTKAIKFLDFLLK